MYMYLYFHNFELSLSLRCPIEPAGTMWHPRCCKALTTSAVTYGSLLLKTPRNDLATFWRDRNSLSFRFCPCAQFAR